MYIAMNRFKVLPGAEEEFETLWLNRDSKLQDVAGFVEFHMLRGPASEDHTLYSSHTVWASMPPSRAGPSPRPSAPPMAGPASTRPLYHGHPHFEGFEVIQTIGRDA